MSRNVISTFFVSLDGVVEAPQEWHLPYFNGEMAAAIGAAMGSSDAMLCGRVTYHEWARFWPGADNEMAEYMNATPTYVASTTLADGEKHALELVDSRTFSTGVVYATCTPLASPGGS